MVLLVFYLLLAIGVSFLCSILEAVLLSVTPSFVHAQVAKGSTTGELLRKMKKDVDRPLAAILTLNTIAHTVGAAGVGAQAAVVLESVPVGVISGVLTLLILVLSEIIPKTLGATYWRTLAPLAARVTAWLVIGLYPFVLLANAITLMLGRSHHQKVSREEIGAIADLGLAEGVLDEGENRVLKNVMRLRTVTVAQVMTPRPVVQAYAEDRKIGTLRGELPTLAFSRLLVFDGKLDHITGYALKDDLLAALMGHQDETTVGSYRHDVMELQETDTVYHAFNELVEQQEHVAAVMDRFGSFAGVFTLEDAVETILGLEIVDEADTVADLQQLALQRREERLKRQAAIRSGNGDAVADD